MSNIDPSAVKAGDTVTLDSDELVANVTGRVTDIQHDHGAWTIYLTLGVMGHSTPFVVGVGTSWRLVAHHQPAPKPEWKPGTVGTATVQPFGADVRVLRSNSGRGWYCEAGFFEDAEVTGFVPDEPRPLPTREHLRNIVGVAHLGAGNGMVDRITDAVMSALGGAS